jgi:hypothetical protein
VGEIEEAAGVYAETKIQELAERKLRFDKRELTQAWDKIQRRQRQALIPTIESTQSLGQDLGRSLTLSRTADEEWPIPASTVDRLGAMANKAHPCLEGQDRLSVATRRILYEKQRLSDAWVLEPAMKFGLLIRLE